MRSSLKSRVERIQERVKRLKMRKVVEAGDEPKEKTFRYIIMNLPVERVSNEKLDEMREKTRNIAALFKTREAVREDIPSLCDLYNTAFFQCPDPYRPVTIDDMTQIYDHSHIILGSMYGMDSAFIVIKFEEQENEDGVIEKIAVVCGIAVHPRHRQKGLATATGLAAWEFLEEKPLDMLQCEVYEKNEPSLSFISWVGFRPVGELLIKASSANAINPLERI